MKKLVPQIRFPQFTDDWEQRKLEDFCSLISKQTGFDYSNSIKSSLVTSPNNDTLPFIQNKDFEGKNINLDTDYYIPISIANKFPKITLDQSCLLISISGKIGNVGLYTLKSKAFIGGAVGICRLFENVNGDFILQELLSENGQRYFKSLIKASSHANITVEDIRKIEIMIPSVNEQQKIGTFFSNLDNLITLHQRELDSYKKLKQAMLQKMFPQGNSKVPEIRFPEFSGEWEKRKCRDVLIERNIQHPQSEDFPLVSFTVESGVTPKTERYEREQLVKGDKTIKKYKETRLNDIVYNPANLKFGAIARNKYGNAVFSPIYVTYEVDEMIAQPVFVEMFVTRYDFIQNALQYQQGTVYERMAVGTEDFAQLDIFLPTLEEQQQISSYFANLDILIAFHQRELDSYKKLKQAMLQKMFV